MYLHRIVFGFILILCGIVFLLYQLGVVTVDFKWLVKVYWPVVLIFIGLQGFWRLRKAGCRHIHLWNAVMIALGFAFLAKNLGWLDVSFGEIAKFAVPVFLIVLGVSLLFKPGHQNGERHEDWRTRWDYDENTFEKHSFIGDLYLGQEFWELRPANISHFVGDVFIDLTKAKIVHPATKIAVSSFIGDIKVLVPNDPGLAVEVSASNFIGALNVLGQDRGGFFNSIHAHSADPGDAEAKITLFISSFIGDIRVTKVG